VFVFYDDVQYDKHGWRNRNRIKTANGSSWLTIPVRSKGVVKDRVLINEVPIDWTKDWARKHWMTIKQSYGKAPYFTTYAPALLHVFEKRYEMLADFTIELTITVAGMLGIQHAKFLRSSDLRMPGARTEKLINILTHLGATHYVSGPSAKEYLEEHKLAEANISLEYMTYDYPEYRQLYPPFDPSVSVLDLLFLTGPEADGYIWKVRA